MMEHDPYPFVNKGNFLNKHQIRLATVHRRTERAEMSRGPAGEAPSVRSRPALPYEIVWARHRAHRFAHYGAPSLNLSRASGFPLCSRPLRPAECS